MAIQPTNAGREVPEVPAAGPNSRASSQKVLGRSDAESSSHMQVNIAIQECPGTSSESTLCTVVVQIVRYSLDC